MAKSTSMGMNKTGIDMAPILGQEMKEFAAEAVPHPASDEDIDYREIKRQYTSESDNVGSIPLPGTLKGMASVAKKKLMREQPGTLVDKLGERLAFERSGVRLYDALLIKCGESELDLPMERLRQIRDEELSHFHMLSEVMRDLGADPTAQTPAADVSAVASMGIIQVVNDPRTDLNQALNAILTAELTDAAGWDLLIELANQADLDDYLGQFSKAQEAEAEHVATIKNLLSSLSVKSVQ